VFLKYRDVQLKYNSAYVLCLQDLFTTDCYSPQSIKYLILNPKETHIHMYVTLESCYVTLRIITHIFNLVCASVFMSDGFQSHCYLLC